MCFSCPSLSLSCFLFVSLLVVLLNSKETQAELGWTSYPPNGVSLHCVCVCVFVCAYVSAFVCLLFSHPSLLFCIPFSLICLSLFLSHAGTLPHTSILLSVCLPVCPSVCVSLRTIFTVQNSLCLLIH